METLTYFIYFLWFVFIFIPGLWMFLRYVDKLIPFIKKKK